jgi:hypothetical protein
LHYLEQPLPTKIDHPRGFERAVVLRIASRFSKNE